MTDLFLKVVNLGISACWIIAAVLIVRAVFAKRMPKWISCCLWGLVALRLVIPFTVESELSLVPNRQVIVDVNSGFTAEKAESTENRGDFSVGNVTDTAVSDSAFADTQYGVNDTSVNADKDLSVSGGVTDTDVTPEGIGVYNEAVNANDGSIAVEEKSQGLSRNTASVLSVIWLCGIAAMSVYAGISYAVLKKRIALSVPFGDGLRKSETVESPFVFGFFRPRIYLPFGLGEETEKYVISHEHAHIKRKDHFIKPLGFLILSVYWFNPLVWVSYILLCRDIEYACDEKVINGLAPEARKKYALALLECASFRRRISACPVAFGEIGVKERVKNTMNYKKPAFWIVVVGVVVCMAVAVLFLTTASDGEDDPDTLSGSEAVSEDASEEQSDFSQYGESSADFEESEPMGYEVEYENDLFCAGAMDSGSYSSSGGGLDFNSDIENNVIGLYITPYKNITDFYIYKIQALSLDLATPKYSFDELLYHSADVNAGRTLAVEIELGDTIPVNAVAFLDGDGKLQCFGIIESPVDGSLLFSDVMPVFDMNETDLPEVSNPENGSPEISEPEIGEPETDEPIIEAHSHSYSASTVAATCKSEGYTLHKCDCGDEYKDQYTAKSVQHDFPRMGTVYGYDCRVCGLRVCAKGNYDGSIPDTVSPIKYYITGGRNTGEDRTLVIYGSGEIPDRPEWANYWNMETGCYPDEITEIVICEGITSIGSNAFNCIEREYCRVNSIVIPSSVTHIGDKAFAGVTGFSGVFYMSGVRTTGDDFLPPKCNAVYMPETFEYTTHNFALNEYIYYQGTEEQFATIGFCDYYNGAKPLVELYESYGYLERIRYNS